MTKKILAYKEAMKLENLKTTRSGKQYKPDSREGDVYIFTPELKLAAEIALVTGRPLLLRGDPGSGKSSFAAFVARNLNWRYYDFAVNVRSHATDIMYRYDTVRRLRDAHSGEKARADEHEYISPGVLWWVFDRELAFSRGRLPDYKIAQDARISKAAEPNAETNADRDPDGAVLLIDEIDKADPDFPNELLVPLGSGYFSVQETQTLVQRKAVPVIGNLRSPLVMITTNEERALPEAFVRRCIVHQLPAPEPNRLVEIAKLHFGKSKDKSADDELFRELATKIMDIRERIADRGVKKPSTAEYLDSIKACREMNIKVGSDAWKVLEQVAVSKGRTDGKIDR
ncbi:MAG: MoxR family ATPase [candidate division Zixibacteria bacterium]